MKFISTRDPNGPSVSFAEALFRGIAPDGGLYHPSEVPDLRALIRSLGADASFVDCAAAMIQGLLGDEYDAAAARDLAIKAFPFRPELREIEPGIHLLDLFQGPSCAFKDYGASFLAATMEAVLLRRESSATEGTDRAVILTATSGDTGSAVAHAFSGRRNIDVVILYPSGRVSPLQEKQLTTLGGNILALEVDGSFDDCQRMVKEAFADPILRDRLTLTSANSINVGRLIPQSFYYVYAFAQLKERDEDELIFCVPSGNFGNLTAGILAWHWGMAVSSFIAATNANDVVPEFLNTGVFRPRQSVRTLANAMDVGNPSNFERLEFLFGNTGVQTMKGLMRGVSVTDETIAVTMRDLYRRRGTLVCPHTAVGVHAARGYLAEERAENTLVVTLATAHPAKFVEICRDAVGVEPEIPDRLARLLDLPKMALSVDNTLAALSGILLERFS
jgi:threonine synthase